MVKDAFDEIMKDAEKKFYKAVEQTAEEVTYEIEKAYEIIIDIFYDDYDPDVYERTYSTYLASDHYNDLLKLNDFGTGVVNFGNSYFAGITVDYNNIPGNPYKANKWWVFRRTFYGGIHGFNRNDIIRRNRDKKKGEERIKIKTPTNMYPPPVKEMNKAFNKITSRSNLDRIFNEQLKSVGL